MKRVTTISAVVIGSLITCLVITQPSVIRTSAQQKKPDVGQNDNPPIVKTFEGDAVLLRGNQLRKTNKAVARAMKDAKDRGLRAAFQKGVIVHGRSPRKPVPTNGVAFLGTCGMSFIRPASFGYTPPQDTFTDGEVEITFLPYDDGDPNTWEGIIYRYVPGVGEDTSYAVIDIAGEEPDVPQEYFYPPDGGDPTPNPLLLTRKDKNGNLRSHKLPTVKVRQQSGCPPGQHICLGAQNAECCLDSGLPGVRTWVKRSARYCAYAGLACRLSGPGWGSCFGGWCGAGIVVALFY